MAWKDFFFPQHIQIYKKIVNEVLVCLAWCYFKGGEVRKLGTMKSFGMYKGTSKGTCAVTTNS